MKLYIRSILAICVAVGMILLVDIFIAWYTPSLSLGVKRNILLPAVNAVIALLAYPVFRRIYQNAGYLLAFSSAVTTFLFYIFIVAALVHPILAYATWAITFVAVLVASDKFFNRHLSTHRSRMVYGLAILSVAAVSSDYISTLLLT